MPARRSTWKAAKRCGSGRSSKRPGRLPDHPHREIGRGRHLRAHDEVREQAPRPSRRRIAVTARIERGGERRGLGVRSDVGQRIDARPARQRIFRAVHVQRDEHRRVEPPRHRRAIVEAERAAAVVGHGDAHPPALDQPVAKLAGQRQRQILFGDRAGHAARAGVAAAMAGIEDDDRPPPRARRRINAVAGRRRQGDGQALACTDGPSGKRADEERRRTSTPAAAPPIAAASASALDRSCP